MENIQLIFQYKFQIDKLKLLNYEGTLLKEMKMKPISRYYFLNSTNPGEQFFMFTSLCAFCVRKMGKNFEQPEEFMDPTTLVSKIMEILQELVKTQAIKTHHLSLNMICLISNRAYQQISQQIN